MKVWGIRAIKENTNKEPSEVGMVTTKHNSHVWMLISGMSIGRYSSTFDCDCITNRKSILRERILLAEAAIEDNIITKFDIIEFNLTEIGIKTGKGSG